MKDFNKIEQSNDSSASQWEVTPAEMVEIEEAQNNRESEKRNIDKTVLELLEGKGVNPNLLSVLNGSDIMDKINSLRNKDGDFDSQFSLDKNSFIVRGREYSEGKMINSMKADNFKSIKIMSEILEDGSVSVNMREELTEEVEDRRKRNEDLTNKVQYPRDIEYHLSQELRKTDLRYGSDGVINYRSYESYGKVVTSKNKAGAYGAKLFTNFENPEYKITDIKLQRLSEDTAMYRSKYGETIVELLNDYDKRELKVSDNPDIELMSPQQY